MYLEDNKVLTTIGTLIGEYLIDPKDQEIKREVKVETTKATNDNKIFKSSVDQYIKENMRDVVLQYVEKVRRAHAKYRKNHMLVKIKVDIIAADINNVTSYRCKHSATVNPVELV